MEGRNRKLNRWQGYDYAQSGLYFVTICTHQRIQWFGRVKNGEMILNQYGKIADKLWREIPNHYDGVIIDIHQIMPNHVHGIIGIVGTGHCPVRPADGGLIVRRTIGQGNALSLRGIQITNTACYRKSSIHIRE